MAMLDESKDAVMATPSVTGITPASGLASTDPDAQARMREAMKMRGMDYARAGIMGAAAGGQAGAQTMNPLAAFVQGMAAGLQAPAQIYEQKRQQAQSVYDATPFGATHPEVVKDDRYSVLAGLPTGIALKVIGAIAQDAAKVSTQAKADMEKMGIEKILAQAEPADLKSIQESVYKFESSPITREFMNASNAYTDITTAPNDIPGHKMLLVKFAQMMNPSVRVNEQTMDAMDASGTLDKMTSDILRRMKGTGLMSKEDRAKIERAAAVKLSNAERDYYPYRAAIVEQAEKRGISAEVYFNPRRQYKNPNTGEVVWGRIIGGKLVTED